MQPATTLPTVAVLHPEQSFEHCWITCVCRLVQTTGPRGGGGGTVVAHVPSRATEPSGSVQLRRLDSTVSTSQLLQSLMHSSRRPVCTVEQGVKSSGPVRYVHVSWIILMADPWPGSVHAPTTVPVATKSQAAQLAKQRAAIAVWMPEHGCPISHSVVIRSAARAPSETTQSATTVFVASLLQSSQLDTHRVSIAC